LAKALADVYPDVINEPITCAEIGSFEGRGSRLIHDHLCQHPDSRLYCIDPWDDVYVKQGEDSKFKVIDHIFQGQYQRFIANTAEFPKIIPMQGYSTYKIPQLPMPIDFAFIDGDHSPDQVYMDGCLMMSKMRTGGIIVFDDYRWCRNNQKCGEGIDRFMKDYAPWLEILHKSDYVIVKVKNPDVPTPEP